MPKRVVREPIQYEWKRWKGQDGIEYYGHPSPLARELWLYLIGIGKARCKPGYSFQRAGNRLGHLLHYVHRGEMWHRMTDKVFRAGKGNACLLDLSRKFSQGNDTSHTLDLWWILFDGKDAPRLRTELSVERDPVFDQLDRIRMEALFLELWRLTVHPLPAREARTDAVLRTILAELFASRAEQGDWTRLIAHGNQLSEKVQLAIDFMERLYFRNIGLKHIAAATGLNLHHFCRRFHDEVGMPPIQYLNRFRIEQAKRLLTTTEKSIAEVGRLVGVLDQDYFSRSFRKQLGESPQSYRGRARRTGATR